MVTAVPFWFMNDAPGLPVLPGIFLFGDRSRPELFSKKYTRQEYRLVFWRNPLCRGKKRAVNKFRPPGGGGLRASCVTYVMMTMTVDTRRFPPTCCTSIRPRLYLYTAVAGLCRRLRLFLHIHRKQGGSKSRRSACCCDELFLYC